jgi:dienelactone hydrolase
MPIRSSTVVETFRVRGGAGWLYGQLVRPRHARDPLPCVVMIPGGIGAGRTMVLRATARDLAAQGVVVAGFNARGRTSGKLRDRRSAGRNDFCGRGDQDDLAAVIRHLAGRPGVDPARLGIYACSFGLVAAAGCLAHHPDLPVAWLVDEEGPSDACAAMLCAWRLAPTGGAPLPSHGRAAPAPVVSPDTGRPDPAKALELFGHACGPHGGSPADRAWWAEREAIRFLPEFRGRYLRLQAEHDHVQPPYGQAQRALFERAPAWWPAKHACDLVNAALDGGVPWVQVNLSAHGNEPNARYGAEHRPVLLEGAMSDHPDAWAQAVRELFQRA